MPQEKSFKGTDRRSAVVEFNRWADYQYNHSPDFDILDIRFNVGDFGGNFEIIVEFNGSEMSNESPIIPGDH